MYLLKRKNLEDTKRNEITKVEEGTGIKGIIMETKNRIWGYLGCWLRTKEDIVVRRVVKWISLGKNRSATGRYKGK